jgi:Na+-driven multidrug efflux pump
MLYLTLGGVLKIGCTFLFVAVFKWQVVWVALATIISWAISAFLAVRALVKNEGIVKRDRTYAL